MTEPAPTPLGRKAATPVASSERITSLDAIRGVAALGILVMNATSFGLASAGYYNLDADGSDNVLDWTIGVLSMILVDQKMMAIFSLLFGVGVVVFAERAQAKGRRVNWLSMWRFVLLAVFGLLHTLIWEGDVLLLYALCAPIVLALRNRRPLTLLVAGSVLTLLSAAVAPAFQAAVGADGAELGEVWFADANGHADVILGYVLIDGFGNTPFFLMVHYFDPHDYYDPPPEHGDLFPGLQRQFRDGQGKFSAQVLKLQAGDADHGSPSTMSPASERSTSVRSKAVIRQTPSTGATSSTAE